MFSPLLQSIIDRHGYEIVDHDGLDDYARSREHVMLFFAGDAERMAESNDVAVVLPELHSVFSAVLTPAIVARDSERQLQRLYRFNSFPSLVFLRHGEYLGVIQGIQDWTDYLQQIVDILGRDPSDPPPFKFPDGCGAPMPSQVH